MEGTRSPLYLRRHRAVLFDEFRIDIHAQSGAGGHLDLSARHLQRRGLALERNLREQMAPGIQGCIKLVEKAKRVGRDVPSRRKTMLKQG